MHLNDLTNMINQYLDTSIKDYCVNGLQIGNTSANKGINKIVTAVSFEEDLIDRAIDAGADALLVHHGLFWNHQNHQITAKNYDKVAKLVANNLSLLAYHLPLDFHPMYGNNVTLFKRIYAELCKDESLGDIGFSAISAPTVEKPVSIFQFNSIGNRVTNRHLFSALASALNIDKSCIRKTAQMDSTVIKLGICTGGGQNYYKSSDYDAYITGEAGLPQSIIAKEMGTSFFAAGHHNTERYGVQAMGELIANKAGIEHEFIDIPVDA
jgi:dinuclear metal center YbgI/SA1388 family protein